MGYCIPPKYVQTCQGLRADLLATKATTKKCFLHQLSIVGGIGCAG